MKGRVIINNIDKLYKYIDKLPDACRPFLMETNNEFSINTKISYARDLYLYFSASYTNPKVSLEDIKMITGSDISKYTTMCLNDGQKERTVARKRATLSSFFSYLCKNNIIDNNPVSASAKIKIHQSDDVIHLDIDEQIKFLDNVKSGIMLTNEQQKYHNRYMKRDIALITLLFDTGIRISELHQLNIQDVDFDKCSFVATRKGGNIQTIYFSNMVKELLEEYLFERETRYNRLGIHEPLFVSLNGNRLGVRAIQRLMKKYAVAIPSKGSKITPHKARSSFAMSFYEETKDILTLQRKLGHKSLAATNIYAKATDKQMEKTRNVLADRLNKNKPEPPK